MLATYLKYSYLDIPVNMYTQSTYLGTVVQSDRLIMVTFGQADIMCLLSMRYLNT